MASHITHTLASVVHTMCEKVGGGKGEAWQATVIGIGCEAREGNLLHLFCELRGICKHETACRASEGLVAA